MSKDYLNSLQERAIELTQTGLNGQHAFGRAQLESLLDQWPTAWGDDLQVFLYGDFKPPDDDLEFPSLGIRILAAPIQETVVSAATIVLAVRVSISEKSVEQLIDASRRLNILLGSWSLVTWGSSPIGWWSHLWHGSGGPFQVSPNPVDLRQAVSGILALPEEAGKRLQAALYWIREPGRLARETHRPDLLRRYAAYWNAFECLVETVAILHPQPKLTKTQKKNQINKYLAEHRGNLTCADVEYLYRNIVNTGFVGKAQHALQVCFGTDAKYYANECFSTEKRKDRLYDIRNAINHGEIDAENPDELLRIESRFLKLFGSSVFRCSSRGKLPGSGQRSRGCPGR